MNRCLLAVCEGVYHDLRASLYHTAMTERTQPSTSYPSQIPVAEAIATLQDKAPRLERESVRLEAAYGRVLAADLPSLVDHPSHDNSALDGYACRAQDTLSARPDAPVRLSVTGDVPAGSLFEKRVEANQAVSIYTGAPVPPGADAIIRVEDTERQGAEVLLYAPAKPGDIRLLGQDFRRGAVGLRAGRRLDAATVGLAAAMGYAEVEVARRPRVGILATGDEVLEPGTPLRPGQVYNSNSYSVAGLVRAAGAEPLILPRVRDDPEQLARALARAGRLELLLTSGGVSMGNYDFVRDLLFDSGAVHFWKVAQKPAGPVLFGQWRDLPVLGLPGNPVSSMIAFLMLGRAFVHAALGESAPLPYYARRRVRAGVTLKSAGFKETFTRVRLEPRGTELYAVSTGNQSSGVLSSMGLADALAAVPPHTVYEPGDELEVIGLAGLLG